MAKYSGKIGFVFDSAEVRPGIWDTSIVERPYYGDIIRNSRRLESDDKVNGDINVFNEFSIVADAYAYENFFAMRYIKWMGVNWKITDVEVQRPRLILSIGGIYNGSPN